MNDKQYKQYLKKKARRGKVFKPNIFVRIWLYFFPQKQEELNPDTLDMRMF